MNTNESGTLELTMRVVLLGVVLSVVMGAANVYLGLKAGMTVSASIPAAVIGMLILRGLFRDGTILEANQVQTAASAGESLAAGIIFTMPALVLIGVWQEFDMVLTTLIAFTGGLLGILFMIPMRRVFVLGDNDELTYPEGVACAAVLKTGTSDEGSGGADAILKGGLVGVLVKLAISYFGVFKGTLEGAFAASNRLFFFGGDVSPALVAVGYIVRLNVALLIFFGGAMAWLIGIPLLGGAEAFLENPVDGAYELWSTKIRYVGVGAMVVGGIAAIIKVRHGLVEAVQTIRRGMSAAGGDGAKGEDIPGKAILGLSILATTLVAGIYFHLTQNPAITAATTVIMLVMSLFFTAVASYIVGLVGNSNSPVSGMTITAVLFTGGLLTVFGFSGTTGMIATLGVAAIVCCAACTSGDVCKRSQNRSSCRSFSQKTADHAGHRRRIGLLGHGARPPASPRQHPRRDRRQGTLGAPGQSLCEFGRGFLRGQGAALGHGRLRRCRGSGDGHLGQGIGGAQGAVSGARHAHRGRDVSALRIGDPHRDRRPDQPLLDAPGDGSGRDRKEEPSRRPLFVRHHRWRSAHRRGIGALGEHEHRQTGVGHTLYDRAHLRRCRAILGLFHPRFRAGIGLSRSRHPGAPGARASYRARCGHHGSGLG